MKLAVAILVVKLAAKARAVCTGIYDDTDGLGGPDPWSCSIDDTNYGTPGMSGCGYCLFGPDEGFDQFGTEFDGEGGPVGCGEAYTCAFDGIHVCLPDVNVRRLESETSGSASSSDSSDDNGVLPYPLCKVCDPSDTVNYEENNIYWEITHGDPVTGCVCPGDCPSWSYRSLEESPFERHLHETTSDEDIAKVIEETGGSAQTNVREKEGLLSTKQCELLKAFVDKGLEKEGRHFHQKYRDDYAHDIPIPELTSMLGLETTQSLLAFFYEAIGSKAPIMRAYVRRSFADEDLTTTDQHVPYHVEDDRYIMVVALNGREEYSGGELVYLDRNGPKEAVRVPGKAIVHGPGDIHGVAPHNGTRYTLFFWAKPEGYCILTGTEVEESLKNFDMN